MHRTAVIVFVAVTAVGATWVGHALAAQQRTAAANVTVPQLQRQVADLQRRVKILALLSLQHTTEINALQTRKLTLTRQGGTPTFLSPNAAAAVPAGFCINGVAVSAGIVTAGASVVGVTLQGDSWKFLMWNTLGTSVLATPEVECLSW
jgi:hypothetical protein